MSGKVLSVTRTEASTKANLTFDYDASGQRIAKHVHEDDGTVKSTYYVRDASGNVMSVYTATSTQTASVKEQYIYGSSRIGVYNAVNNTTSNARTLGLRHYELTDHLGNVRVVLSDYQQDIISASDYYPFGMVIEKGRRVLGNEKYRYGFNGKELDGDDEGMGGGGSTYDYGFRIYNPNISRFLSIDPLSPQYPWYTPYQFAGNKPIVAIDLDGLEELIVVKEFTKASTGNVQTLIRTTEREVGFELFSKKIVGYEFTLNGKTYTANSNQTTFGRDGRGVNPGVEGNFSSVYTLTKDDWVNLFATGFNVINRYKNIDDAYLNESVGNGAELDFKFTLYTILGVEQNALIEIDGVVYNANEAGNFVWSALNEYADEVTDLTALMDPSSLAQAGTNVGQLRMDEANEQKACDDGENYGIELSEDKDFNRKVQSKIDNKEMFDESYVEEDD